MTPLPGEWPWDQVGRLDSRIPGNGMVVTESIAKLNRLLFKYGKLQSLGRTNNAILEAATGKRYCTMTAMTMGSSDEQRIENVPGASRAEAAEEAARQLLEANHGRLLHLLAECEAQELASVSGGLAELATPPSRRRLAPADSKGDRGEVEVGSVMQAKFKPKVGSVVQAKYKPTNPYFQLARVVESDNETCGLQFLKYNDVTTIPITDIRSLASAMPREDSLLVHVIIAQAVLIREEIAFMTCGQLKDFPKGEKAELEEAREAACAIIHALSFFKREGDPFVDLDPEERNKKMMDKVVSLYAYLDERYPRLPGDCSRSEIFARHRASVMNLPGSSAA